MKTPDDDPITEVGPFEVKRNLTEWLHKVFIPGFKEAGMEMPHIVDWVMVMAVEDASINASIQTMYSLLASSNGSYKIIGLLEEGKYKALFNGE